MADFKDKLNRPDVVEGKYWIQGKEFCLLDVFSGPFGGSSHSEVPSFFAKHHVFFSQWFDLSSERVDMESYTLNLFP